MQGICIKVATDGEKGGKIKTGWLELGGNAAHEKNATKSMYMQPGGQLLYPITVIKTLWQRLFPPVCHMCIQHVQRRRGCSVKKGPAAVYRSNGR